jgi:hypothetical protein
LVYYPNLVIFVCYMHVCLNACVVLYDLVQSVRSSLEEVGNPEEVLWRLQLTRIRILV